MSDQTQSEEKENQEGSEEIVSSSLENSNDAIVDAEAYMKEKLQYRGETASNAWMLTFADLLALLLAFFILIYSMSIIKRNEWKEIVESMSKFMNPKGIREQTSFVSRFSVLTEKLHEAIDLDYLQTIINEKISAKQRIQDKVAFRRKDDRLILTFKHSDIFYGGTTELKPEAEIIFYDVGNIVRTIGNEMAIRSFDAGLANLEPDINNFWELTLLQSKKIVKEIQQYGYPFSVNAYGTKYSYNENDKLGARIDLIFFEHKAGEAH